MFLDLIRLTVSVGVSHYSNVFVFPSELRRPLVRRLASMSPADRDSFTLAAELILSVSPVGLISRAHLVKFPVIRESGEHC